MTISRWFLVALLLVAAVIGAGGMMASFAINHATSTDAFCTSCHTMKLQYADQYYQHSKHRSNTEGVRPSCGDCHIPTTNWFIETYVHVTSGVRDVFVELTHDFSDPKVWEARRSGLEQKLSPISGPGTVSPAASVTMPARSGRRAMPAVNRTPCSPRAA